MNRNLLEKVVFAILNASNYLSSDTQCTSCINKKETLDCVIINCIYRDCELNPINAIVELTIRLAYFEKILKQPPPDIINRDYVKMILEQNKEYSEKINEIASLFKIDTFNMLHLLIDSFLKYDVSGAMISSFKAYMNNEVKKIVKDNPNLSPLQICKQLQNNMSIVKNNIKWTCYENKCIKIS